jgi:hypothetical protein
MLFSNRTLVKWLATFAWFVGAFVFIFLGIRLLGVYRETASTVFEILMSSSIALILQDEPIRARRIFMAAVVFCAGSFLYTLFLQVQPPSPPPEPTPTLTPAPNVTPTPPTPSPPFSTRGMAQQQVKASCFFDNVWGELNVMFSQELRGKVVEEDGVWRLFAPFSSAPIRVIGSPAVSVRDCQMWIHKDDLVGG